MRARSTEANRQGVFILALDFVATSPPLYCRDISPPYIVTDSMFRPPSPTRVTQRCQPRLFRRHRLAPAPLACLPSRTFFPWSSSMDRHFAIQDLARAQGCCIKQRESARGREESKKRKAPHGRHTQSGTRCQGTRCIYICIYIHILDDRKQQLSRSLGVLRSLIATRTTF